MNEPELIRYGRILSNGINYLFIDNTQDFVDSSQLYICPSFGYGIGDSQLQVCSFNIQLGYG